MNEVLLHKAIKLNRVRKRRQRWQKVVSIMAAVVVFCTTYALILPAITMGEEPICGQEAHEHTDACYQTRLYTVTCPAAQHVHDASCVDGMGNYTCGFGQVILHSHDESCYDDQGGLICVLQEQYEHLHSDSCVVTTKQLVCQETEREAHTHAESCYGEKQVLTCQTPETPAHTHGESCYGDIKTLVCTQQEYPAHTHSDACYTQTLVLSCTQPETAPHTHSDACNEIRQNLVCTLEENEQHSHSGSCYQTETVRVCGLEETAGHTHGEACYTKEQQLSCTAQEGEGHTHGDSCYHTEKGLICQLAETEGHTHGTACYTTETGLVCALEETAGHTHTESCYEEASTVACGLEQIAVHTHTSECYDASGSRICGITPAAVHVHGEQCVEVTQLEEPQLTCQIPEHVHVDSCYPVENPTVPVDEGFLCGYGVHTHTADCYDEAGALTCNIPEHTHDASCKVADYDETADVESSADWEATLANVKLTGNWPKDILAVAQSQLGYRESTKNVYLYEDGSVKGYTRYGAWYGIPYGDWCAMFVSFCVDYAGAEEVPQDANCNGYITKLTEAEMYHAAGTYTPKPGDIIFFDWDYTEGATVNSDHVGLVVELICDDNGNPVQVKTLEGNSSDRVQYVIYYLNDSVIVGYGNVPEGNTRMLTFQGADYTVTVSFDSSADIPDNAELAVREIEQGTEEYETYYQQAVEAMRAEQVQTQISFARFFDISFVVDGKTIEPSAPVNVQVSYAEAVSIAEEESSAAVHFADEGVEILEAEASQSQETDENLVDTFEFTQNSFSVTGTVTYSAAATDVDLGDAVPLTDYLNAAKFLNQAGGHEVAAYAHSGTFCVELDVSVPYAAFAGDGEIQLYLTLSEALPISSYACDNTAVSIEAEAASNTILVTVPVGAQYQNVTAKITLSGLAANETDDPLTVQLKDNSVTINTEPQAFSCNGSDGVSANLTITGSAKYKPAEYELVVEILDETAYAEAMDSYISKKMGQYEVLDQAALRVYLRNKTAPAETAAIPAGYSLSLNFSQSPLTISNDGSLLAMTLKGGTASNLQGYKYGKNNGNLQSFTIENQSDTLEYLGVASFSGNLAGTTASGYTLTYNTQKDAFIRDSAYAKYYNSNSPIGTAGSFHIVAFNTASLYTHTNGNILAKNLSAGSNFGTNGYRDELSYVQNYISVHQTSASAENHVLVIGSDNTISLTNNNNNYAINSVELTKPKNIIQDANTGETPFIDLGRVEQEIRQITSQLAMYSDANIENPEGSTYNLTNPDAVGIINVSYNDSKIFGATDLLLGGFSKGHMGSIVINVDCTGATEITMPARALVVVDGVKQGTSEVVEFSNGKVLWNFLNAEGVTINSQQMTGMIVAPGATVNILQNLNGTVVAENVNVRAESHRTDFTGRIVPYDDEPEEDNVHVILQKTKSGYAGTTLAGAEFDLYVWSGSDWAKVNTESIVTGTNGLFVLKDLAGNTAYKLVETKAPSGYVLSSEPHYFWVCTDSSLKAPTVKPDDFAASPVSSGGSVIIPNEPAENVQTTSLTIKKSWMASGVAMDEVDVTQITVKVYQHAWLNGEEAGKELYQEKNVAAESNWELTLTDLPLNGKDSQDQDVTYTYSVEEVEVDGYTVTYSENNAVGVADGTVVITNTKDEESGYTLPKTGGVGTRYYTFGGLLLIAAALMYGCVLRRKKRREAVGS